MKSQANLRADIVTVLLADHEQIQLRLETFRRARQAANPSSLRELVSFLVAHETAEELIVYPVVRRQSAGGNAIADDRLREQTEAAHLLRDIEKTPFGEADFWYLVDQLTLAVLEHARAEELSFFRALSTSLEPSQRQKMGRQYQRAMRASPTHPHPLSPHFRPLEAAMTPGVAVIDRARDRRSFRHKHDARRGSGDGDVEVDGDRDVITLLALAHRRLSALAMQLETQAEMAPRPVLDQFSVCLAAHTAVELEVIYPAVQHFRNSDEDLDILKQGRLDHEEIAMALVRLHKVPLNTNEFRQELAHLIGETRLHIGQDEAEILPRLQKLTAECRHELAKKAWEVERHAPTRPHPRTLKSRLGAKLANRVLSLVDRTRSS
jgi:hemerythrin superfamily protein